MRRIGVLVLLCSLPLAAQARGFVVDGDADLVNDETDDCPYTPPGTVVDARGCPLDGDEDRDGVPDTVDACPYSPPRAQIDFEGCALDDDFDGVANGLDACPSSELGARVDTRGCSGAPAPVAAQRPAVPPSRASAPPVLPLPLAEQAREASKPVTEPAAEEPAPAVESAPAERPVPESPATVTYQTPAPELVAPPLHVEPVNEPVPPPSLPAIIPSLPQPAPPEAEVLAVAPPALPPLPPGTPTFSDPLFKSLYFGLQQAELSDSVRTSFRYALPDLRKALNLHPRMVIELVGHADPTTEADKADQLARERAELTQAYLVAQGFDRARVLARARDGVDAAAPPGEAKRNRRVDVFTYPR